MESNKTAFMKNLENAFGKDFFTPLVSEAIIFLLTNQYESFMIVDKNGCYEYLDPYSESRFNLSKGEAKGIKATKIVKNSLFPKVLESKQPSITKIINHGTLKHRSIASAFPIIKDEKVIGAVGHSHFRTLEEFEKVNQEVVSLKKEIHLLRKKQSARNQAVYTFENILGANENKERCIEMAQKASITKTDTLILGESGTGKELYAHSIHNFDKPNKPFIGVNSPAIPFELAESELFGYRKGAFTGAVPGGKPGKLRLADGGTLFLDEISALPLSIQAKLLRALEEREIQVLGDTQPKKVNFHLICASNVDLKQLAKEGKFRLDLYYRIAKTTIKIDPLRKRKSDIPILINHFLKRINSRFNFNFQKFSRDALSALIKHNWPGNVRELINVIEQACLKQWQGMEITLDSLPEEIFNTPMKSITQTNSLKAMKEELERKSIIEMLNKTGGNNRRAANILGIPHSTFYKKLKDYAIDK